MAYSAHEKAFVLKIYHDLVVQDFIGIKEIDEYGDCIPDYSPEGKLRLVLAIQQLASYPWRDHRENAALAHRLPQARHAFITQQTWELELPDLLEKIDIQALLRAHPRYETRLAEWAANNRQDPYTD